MASQAEIEALTDFQSVLNDAAGAHHAALTGLRLWREQLLPVIEQAENPAADFLIGHGAPDGPDTLAYQRWPIDSLSERLSERGPVAQQLSQQWAVFIYTEWEHVYRPRVAEARGVELDEVRDDLMGDIRLMRHDIVHHSGAVQEKNAKRYVLLKWFKPGETIMITTEHVADFMRQVGLTYAV